MLSYRQVAARNARGVLEYKTRVHDDETGETYYADTRAIWPEGKHKFEAFNPAHEGRLRRHVSAATAANDRGDTASVRRHLAAMQTYLDGLLGLDRDGDDDQEDDESKTPRRSRGSQPTVDQPWTSGESTDKLARRQAAQEVDLMTAVARYRARLSG